MSANIKTFINFDRYEEDKLGQKIPIWRKTITYLSKAESQKARENKEQLILGVGMVVHP